MNKSSNFREAANLVRKDIGMVETSQIKEGLDFFVFMYNEVIEQTYTKGYSKSPKLHDLIYEIQKL